MKKTLTSTYVLIIGAMLTITSSTREAQSAEPSVLSGKTRIGKLLPSNPICLPESPDRMTIIDYRALQGRMSCYYHQTRMRRIWNKVTRRFQSKYNR